MSVRAAWACLLLVPALACAQTLYRYIDKDGRVVITDQPPKGVAFERVEFDRNTNVIEGPRRNPVASEGKSGGNDMAARRAKLRDQLRLEVEAAREKLTAARQDLESGREPLDDEWQPTVSAPDNGGKPNKQGVITGRGGRVVCAAAPDGKVSCPAILVPSETYRERLNGLEQAVGAAEEAVRQAELKYRRNAPD